jgi:hypothetical protein
MGLLAIGPSGRLAAQTSAAAGRIDTIIVENRNVFESNEGAPGWVARLANKLHVKTRQSVIRRRLLLDRGDRFDLPRMEESERALRSLGVFRQVRVDTVRRADGRLVLRAVTADGWSTQPQASFSSVAGQQTWSIGMVERNFLGTATELALIYGQDPDRTRLDFEFLNQHLFSRRTLLGVRYAALSDGQRGAWRFGLPFHETAAPHAVETYGETANERVLRFRDGALLDSSQHYLLRAGVSGGISIGGGATTTRRYSRLWGAWEWRREDFTSYDTAAAPYSVFTAVRAGVELGLVRFRIVEHFNSYARREDVDLSSVLRLGIVMQQGVGYEFRAQTSAVWNRGFALLRVDANGLDTTRTRAQVTVVSQNVPRHTLIAHAEGGIVTDPKPGAEFDPWVEQRGPRLFGLHAFTGTRMSWFVLEDRILVVDDMLGLFALGAAPFVEYGGAWYDDQPARQGGDAGVSLRFGPTRAVRGDAAEIAVGYRFGDGVPGKRWGITLRKGFSF